MIFLLIFGAIVRLFKSKVKSIISNDIEYYSFVLNKNYIENHIKISDAIQSIDKLNNLVLINNGFIYKNYCLGSGSNSQYFSNENCQKIDTIKQKIEK